MVNNGVEVVLLLLLLLLLPLRVEVVHLDLHVMGGNQAGCHGDWNGVGGGRRSLRDDLSSRIGSKRSQIWCNGVVEAVGG